MSKQRLQLGERGEELAAAYLRGLGMRIRHRNFRARNGEIDVVAEIDGRMVFVEVRSRGRSDRISPLDSIGADKRKRVRRAVTAYLRATGRPADTDLRIDAIGVTFDDGLVRLEHIENAM